MHHDCRQRIELPVLLIAALLCTLLLATNRLWADQKADSQPPSDASSNDQPASPKSKSGRDGKLPWTPPPKPKGDAPPVKPESARGLLMAIQADQLDRFADGRPLIEEEQQTLYQILFQFSRIKQLELEQLRQPADAWPQLVAAPAEHRFEVFDLRGRVRRVERVPLPAQQASLLEIPAYYRVAMTLEGSSVPVSICALRVPAAWKLESQIDEPAHSVGVFLKKVTIEESPSLPIFAADRIAWYPSEENPATGVTADQAWLSKLGLDLGLLDDARQNNGRKLTDEETDCFYRMLSAVGRAKQDQLRRRAVAGWDLVDLLQKPQDNHGRLLLVKGNARKVTRINVTDEDDRARLGSDHYYQIDLFVSLGKKTIRLGKGTKENPAPVYANRFPVTLCVRRLPPELDKRWQQAKSDFNEPIRVAAFFYKLWAYKSEFTSSYRENQLQPAPMFIGLSPELPPAKKESSPYLGLIAGAIFLVALAGIWIGLWRYNRGDEKFERTTLNRQFELKKGESLDDIEIDTGEDAESGEPE